RPQRSRDPDGADGHRRRARSDLRGRVRVVCGAERDRARLREEVARLRPLRGVFALQCRAPEGDLMNKKLLFLAPVFASVTAVACSSTDTVPVVACGPDNVATTNWDVVATT